MARPLQGVRSYVTFLLLTASVVGILAWASRFAKGSKEADPRGPRKVAVAALAMVLILGGGAIGLKAFHDNLREGMLNELDARMALAVGADAYQGSVDGLQFNLNLMNVTTRQLNNAVAADTENTTQAEREEAQRLREEALGIVVRTQAEGSHLDQARTTSNVEGVVAPLRQMAEGMRPIGLRLEALALQARPPAAPPQDDEEVGEDEAPAEAAEEVPGQAFGRQFRAAVRQFEENLTSLQQSAPNHLLYLRVSEAVAAQDDAEVRRLVATTNVQQEDMHDRMEAAFAIKDKAYRDMMQWFYWFLVPSLVGAFFAPLVFAVGSILRAQHLPSDTVGYKPYPSGAMGLFLLLGGFGVPALFFATWSFQDMAVRRREGQIAL